MSDQVLSLKNISRQYRQGDGALEVLCGVNLDIKPGELVALVGPSGCGKSTLLHIAGLLDAPSAGEVHLCGEAMHGASDARRTRARRGRLGFVYQFHHLLPEFSALENVVLPQLIAGAGEKPAREEAAALLEGLGLGARMAHRPARLSGGEQQRVAIARALANEPALLLADEPTGNLDAATAEEVLALFIREARARGLAALVATHNPELAARMDRVVRLEKGRLQ